MKKKVEKIEIPVFPKRIKLRVQYSGDKVSESFVLHSQEDVDVAIAGLEKLYKPSEINFVLSYGRIEIIDHIPAGLLFKNPPGEPRDVILGRGFESYYYADKDYKKVVRMIEIT